MSTDDVRLTVPFHRPLIDASDIEAVVETLKSGWLTTGPSVKTFEKAFADYLGAREAIAVNSCTAAMHLALAGLDIGPGDKVITTPYTFVGTAEAIQYVGASPVFVDIKEDDFNIDPQKIEEAVIRRQGNGQGGKEGRLRAIMPVHIAGHPCDMVSIMNIANKYGLAVIEDAAHCLEGRLKASDSPNSDLDAPRATHESRNNGPSGDLSRDHRSLKIGAIGDATCFSFYATKNLTTGEGGMVTTCNPELAERMRVLSLHGMSRDAWKRYSAQGSWYYEIVAQGFKYNMPDLLAALGLSQLRKVEKMHATRDKYAQLLMRELADVEDIVLPKPSANVKHAWHLFIIRLQLNKLSITRSEFIEKLRECGIQASVHFIPLHVQPYFQTRYGHKRGDFPVAEQVYESAVSLPLYPAMGEEALRYVARQVKRVIKDHAIRRRFNVTDTGE